jgi:hypothetical protein
VLSLFCGREWRERIGFVDVDGLGEFVEVADVRVGSEEGVEFRGLHPVIDTTRDPGHTRKESKAERGNVLDVLL